MCSSDLTTVIVDTVMELDQAVQQKASEVVIRLPISAELDKVCEAIRRVLEESPGECNVLLEMISQQAVVRMRAHSTLKVRGSSQLEAALSKLGCEINWSIFSPARAAVAAGV